MSSRSSKGFADFFPTAPSVLKDKKRTTGSDRRQHDSPSHEFNSDLRDRERPSSSHHGTPRYSPHSTPRGVKDDRYPSDSRNGVGSTGSTSTSSAVFDSRDSRDSRSSKHTPLSHVDSASPALRKSPSGSRQDAPVSDASREKLEPAAPKQARPGKGQIKGVKTTYDPLLDKFIGSKEQRARKPTFKDITSDDEGEPVEDPRLRILNYTSGKHNHARARLRPAPYILKPYEYDPQTTVNGGPPTRICVTGLDTLTPAASVERLFSSFGDIAECQLAHNPKNGSSLGICLIRFRDSKRGGVPNSAARAAKRAHDECKSGQHRIGQNMLRAVLDRDGTLGREIVLKTLEDLKPKPVQRIPPPPPPQPSRAPVAREESHGIRPSAPPPTAPKGPSGRGGRPIPTGPASAAVPAIATPTPIVAPVPTRPDRPNHLSLVEEGSILDKIERDPYIFLAHECVPVLSTTIPHLKARMKKFDVKDVRADKTGYFIIFRNSRSGEEECARCYQACHLQPMFTYTMELECQKYGNPNYERPPSPETVQAEEKRKAAEARRQKEAALDHEEERLLRAANIDPVKAVVDALRAELKAKLLEDMKARIAGPALYEFLDPAKHVERRKRLGINAPGDNKNRSIFDRAGPSSGTPEYGNEYGRKPLKSKSINISSLPKMRKGRQDISSAFLDDRRRVKPSARRLDVRGLHHRLHQEEEESDDERSAHRDSTTVSRMMSPAVDSDDEDAFPSGRRLIRPKTAWGGDETEDEEEEHIDSIETPQPEIDPQIAKLNQLQAELDSLPPKSRKRKRLEEEIAEQKRQKLDVSGYLKVEPTPEVKVIGTDGKTKAKKPTKKQLLEEQAVLDKARIMEEYIAKNTVDIKIPEPAKTPEPRLPVDMPLVDGVRTGITTGRPKRSVEDDPNLFGDLDGYQTLVKDDEDLRALQVVLAEETAADLGDVGLWAYKQKQLKKLYRNGETGPSYTSTVIPGYYVPNPTGCARTEGVKPISQAEKSKYLPHRIKVQKAREERQRLAKLDPALAAAAAAKEAQVASVGKSSSRSNRVNNRRLVADIAAQKQALASSNGEGDALKFNQLKKRKKPVRFARSAIHGWGLYAMESINQNEMIIEYVGDRVRQQVADVRERNYIRTGIGSSYLFRIDDYTIIDATKKGGIARFINHSCTPNCTAKIIRVDGTKRIVIYALRDVQRDEELTYDYKFEREWDSEDRIPCLCGSSGCKGFLN